MKSVVTKKLYRISYDYSAMGRTETMFIVAETDEECKEIIKEARGDWKLSSFEVVHDTVYLFERL
jgi:hypothetical protein